MKGTVIGSGRSAIWAAILRGAGLLLGAIATILIARVLQPERFGVYAFVFSLVTMMSVPPTIGLRQVLARETAYAIAREETGPLPALWLWAIGWSLVTALVLALALAGWGLIGPVSQDLRTPLLAGALLLLCLPTPQLLAGILQGLGHVIAALTPEALIRPGILLGMIGLIWAGIGFVPATVSAFLLAFAAALLVETIVITLLFLQRSGRRTDVLPASGTRLPRRAATLSALSFGAITSLHLINDNLDILMLGLLTESRETGLYRGATVLSQLVVFGLGVMNYVILPRIAGLHARGDRAVLQRLVTKSAQTISVIAAIGLVVIVVSGRPLLSLLFGPEFAAAHTALIILALGQFANALFGPVALVLNMTGHERLTLIGVLMAVCLNAVLNLALIPLYGIEGAAIASASALILWNVTLAVFLRSRVGYCSTVLRADPRNPNLSDDPT